MKKSDTFVVRNSSGRRAFVRAGAAFLLAGSTVVNSQEEGARVDCDRQGLGEEKNSELAGHDSDSGSNADRPGCGTKKPPVMTEYERKKDTSIRVTKVKV